jgi:hypothetical protein
LFGALAGAHSARPGGIPSHELGGGVGQGAEAASEAIEKRDLANRGQAQQSFVNQLTVKKENREQLEFQARIAQSNAATGHYLQATKFAEDEHPLDMALKQADVEEHATRLQTTRQEMFKNELSIIDTLHANGVQDTAQFFSYQQAAPSAKDIASGKLAIVGNGKPGGDEHGVIAFDPRVLRNPLTKDSTYNTYSLDKNLNVVATPHTIKADGHNTLLDYFNAASAGRQQMLDLYKNQDENARAALTRGQAAEAQTKAALTNQQITSLKSTGVNAPVGFQAPANAADLSQADLQKTLTDQGVTLPPNFAALYALAHYKADPGTYPARTFNRPGQPAQMDRQTAINAVRMLINPNFDEKEWKRAQSAATAFATGKPGQARVSLNTAINHLDRLQDAAKELNNRWSPAWNKMANFLETQTGDPRVTNFNTAATAVESEMATVFKGVGATDQEIKAWRDRLSASQSPEQIQGSINELLGLMAGRLGALNGLWNDATKAPRDFDLLDSNSRGILTKMGDAGQKLIDADLAGKRGIAVTEAGRQTPATAGQGGAAQPPAGATHKVPGPDGKLHWTNAQGTVDYGVAQ